MEKYNNDLEMMRKQMAILKNKLDKQTIVTDKLLHQAMKQKMAWINKYLWFSALILLPFICVAWLQIKEWLGFSWFSYALVVGLSAISIFGDFAINKMNPEDWENGNLVQTAQKLLRMKRIRKIQVSINLPLLVLIFLFVGYETYMADLLPAHDLMIFGIAVMIGLVIGGAVGLSILSKMQRTNDEIIAQIEELTHLDTEASM